MKFANPESVISDILKVATIEGMEMEFDKEGNIVKLHFGKLCGNDNIAVHGIREIRFNNQ